MDFGSTTDVDAIEGLAQLPRQGQVATMFVGLGGACSVPKPVQPHVSSLGKRSLVDDSYPGSPKSSYGELMQCYLALEREHADLILRESQEKIRADSWQAAYVQTTKDWSARLSDYSTENSKIRESAEILKAAAETMRSNLANWKPTEKSIESTLAKKTLVPVLDGSTNTKVTETVHSHSDERLLELIAKTDLKFTGKKKAALVVNIDKSSSTNTSGGSSELVPDLTKDLRGQVSPISAEVDTAAQSEAVAATPRRSSRLTAKQTQSLHESDNSKDNDDDVTFLAEKQPEKPKAKQQIVTLLSGKASEDILGQFKLIGREKNTDCQLSFNFPSDPIYNNHVFSSFASACKKFHNISKVYEETRMLYGFWFYLGLSLTELFGPGGLNDYDMKPLLPHTAGSSGGYAAQNTSGSTIPVSTPATRLVVKKHSYKSVIDGELTDPAVYENKSYSDTIPASMEQAVFDKVYDTKCVPNDKGEVASERALVGFGCTHLSKVLFRSGLVPYYDTPEKVFTSIARCHYLLSQIAGSPYEKQMNELGRVYWVQAILQCIFSRFPMQFLTVKEMDRLPLAILHNLRGAKYTKRSRAKSSISGSSKTSPE